MLEDIALYNEKVSTADGRSGQSKCTQCAVGPQRDQERRFLFVVVVA